MYLNDVDYGQLAGAVEHIHNLLTIFAEWFEESHKANDLDRSHTNGEIAFLWEASPRYDSLLDAEGALRPAHRLLLHCGRRNQLRRCIPTC